MEEKTKLRVTVAVTSLLGLAYFFLCATPLPKPLVLVPRWQTEVPPSRAFPAAPEAEGRSLSFQLGDRYGYFDPDQGLLFSATRSYGASVSDEGFVAYDMKPGLLSFKDERGRPLFDSKEEGYPFVEGARRFVLSSNQSSVAELGPDGSRLWRRDFPSLLTAFASNASIAVFGTLDGRVIALDREGKELLSFAPGGSRIPCIYGCAVSPDGRTIAATAGLDRQRLIVLEKREEAYRVTWHRWTDSAFRRPVAMAFTPDGRKLVFETAGGLGVYDVASRREELLPARNPLVSGGADPRRSLLLALDLGGPRREEVLAASYDGRKLFSFPFSADEAGMRTSGDSLFLILRGGEDERLLRLDFVEE